MSSDLEQEIQRKIHALSDTEQERLLAVIDGFLNGAEVAQGTVARPVWEMFDELSQQVPIEEWAKLPTDGAEQHDHYLYGAPKRRIGAKG